MRRLLLGTAVIGGDGRTPRRLIPQRSRLLVPTTLNTTVTSIVMKFMITKKGWQDASTTTDDFATNAVPTTQRSGRLVVAGPFGAAQTGGGSRNSACTTKTIYCTVGGNVEKGKIRMRICSRQREWRMQSPDDRAANDQSNDEATRISCSRGGIRVATSLSCIYGLSGAYCTQSTYPGFLRLSMTQRQLGNFTRERHLFTTILVKHAPTKSNKTRDGKVMCAMPVDATFSPVARCKHLIGFFGTS